MGSLLALVLTVPNPSVLVVTLFPKEPILVELLDPKEVLVLAELPNRPLLAVPPEPKGLVEGGVPTEVLVKREPMGG